jgi:hypothetical protein
MNPLAMIIVALVKDVVVPEVILAYRRAQEKKSGDHPTEAEVLTEFEANTAEGIARGEAFLARIRG